MPFPPVDMAKKRPPSPKKGSSGGWKKYLPALMVAAVLACYWTPLTAPNASIQWDAADEFQPGQKYLSDELLAGRLPFWTPYLFAGFPFLADPQLARCIR